MTDTPPFAELCERLRKRSASYKKRDALIDACIAAIETLSTGLREAGPPTAMIQTQVRDLIQGDQALATLTAQLAEARAELERTANNRAMWRNQCSEQAREMERLRERLQKLGGSAASGGVFDEFRRYVARATINATETPDE